MTRRGTEPERRPVYFRRTTEVVKRRLKFRQSLNWRYELKVGDEPMVVVTGSELNYRINGHSTDMYGCESAAAELHDAGDLTTWVMYPYGAMEPGWGPGGVTNDGVNGNDFAGGGQSS